VPALPSNTEASATETNGSSSRMVPTSRTFPSRALGETLASVRAKNSVPSAMVSPVTGTRSSSRTVPAGKVSVPAVAV
jgi:hypothetical protein